MRISDWSSDVCSTDLGGEFTAEDIDAMLAAQKKKCWYCGTKLTAYHVDHRIPLARGGSNGPENLVIACPACNLSKGAKMPWETANPRDRKSVVTGQSGSVRVDLGGRHTIKKKNKNEKQRAK